MLRGFPGALGVNISEVGALIIIKTVVVATKLSMWLAVLWFLTQRPCHCNPGWPLGIEIISVIIGVFV
jgi:hypothetical protein